MTDNTQAPSDRASLLRLLGEVKHAVIDELHRRLVEEGYSAIREVHGCVFSFVDAEGSRLTDLAERARITKQAVGEVVDDLETLGYVERAPHPVDRRAKLIRLTDQGEEAHLAAARIFADIEHELADRFGEERFATLREVLEEIAADAGATARAEPVASVR